MIKSKKIDSFFKRKACEEDDKNITSTVSEPEKFVEQQRSEEKEKQLSKVPRLTDNEIEIERDPGKRPPIWQYPPDQVDEIRRAYLKCGPYQNFLEHYPFSGKDDRQRRFQYTWFCLFPSWLEYSPSKDAAYCLPCYLFSKKPSGRPGSDVFIATGFRNWKKVRNGKKCAFLTHIGKDPCSSHNNALKACQDLLNQNGHIRNVFHVQSSDQLMKNRLCLKTSIDTKMATRTVDLRSDTVTKPTEAMRTAMANADVDDDVLGHDPTCFRLETEMAKIMGKEAALFVPSGTMANLISVLVHCDIRGSEVILGDNSHIHIYENGGIATIGGVHPRTVRNNEDGTMDIDLIEAAIRNPNLELIYPTTRLICLENTHGNSGGRCLSVEYTERVGKVAKKHGLMLHIDGARIFNASVALGVPVDRLVQAADSVSVCLSKGLGAPVGSVIVGSSSFIAKARRLRKTVGGGMRQVGILCAAALVALQDIVGELESDHKKARTLADGLNQIKGLRVDTSSVETNIVYIEIKEGSGTTAAKLSKDLENYGVLLMPLGSSKIRVVFHHQISDSDVQYALSCFQQAVNGVGNENGN